MDCHYLGVQTCYGYERSRCPAGLCLLIAECAASIPKRLSRAGVSCLGSSQMLHGYHVQDMIVLK